MLPFAPGLLAFIAGQSQAGKSFIAVKQAVCLASGEPFFGYPVRKPVGVIYLAAEGEGAIDRRFKVAKDALGITRKLPIAVLKARVDLANKRHREQFAVDVSKVADYMIRSRMCDSIGIIYLDTVAAAVAMKDENDNAEVSVVCGHIRDIGHKVGCVMSPIIHMGKNDGAGIRGGSNWTGHGDIVSSIYADRDKDGTAQNRRIAIAKHRDGEEGPISGFQLRYVELGKHPEYGDSYGSCAIDPCDADWKAKSEKPRKVSMSRQTFDDAFVDMLCAYATTRSVRGDGPMVQAVALEHVEREFKSRYVTDGSAPKQQAENRKKAWQRTLAAVIKCRAYAADVDRDGRQWIWRLESDE